MHHTKSAAGTSRDVPALLHRIADTLEAQGFRFDDGGDGLLRDIEGAIFLLEETPTFMVELGAGADEDSFASVFSGLIDFIVTINGETCMQVTSLAGGFRGYPWDETRNDVDTTTEAFVPWGEVKHIYYH